MDMNQHELPGWTDDLRRELERMASEIPAQAPRIPRNLPVFIPENSYHMTASLQKAIDEASERGGGIVRIDEGNVRTGTLVLRSHVYLEVRTGARLTASDDLADFPEHIAKRRTVQDTNMGMNQSLIFAEGCTDIGIFGGGVISGQGTPDHFPGDETCNGTPGRPFLIRMIDCRNITLRDITLTQSACWMQNYLNCENLHLDHITVRNHANYNNDGIDVDGCRRVYIHDVRISSGDDALCFKGASERATEDVLVENCDFDSACNAIKIGTDTQGDFRRILIRHCHAGGLSEDPSGLKHAGSDSAVSLEMLDGGTVEDIWITGLHVSRAFSPFFVRIEDRGRVKPEDPKPGVGILRRVLIEHVRGYDCGPRGSYMIGSPLRAIEQIAFSDVLIEQYASKKYEKPEDYPEFIGVYPDAHMIDDIGDAPAYALWTRHVRGLSLRDYRVIADSEEKRPETVFEDTTFAE